MNSTIQAGFNHVAVFAAMATPAVLLLANAMLILSTNQRLQAVLERVRENEEIVRRSTDSGITVEVRHELEAHGRRASIAHRALLALYASAALLLVMIGALGSATLGLPAAQEIALGAAFAGAGLLLLGVGLLAAETWIGVRAIDGRIRRLLRGDRTNGSRAEGA